MEEPTNVFDKEKKKIQDLMNEAISMSSHSKDVKDSIDIRVYHEQIISQQILEKYNKENRTDFQAQLYKLIEPTTLEKVRASLEGKDITAKGKAEQEKVQDEAKRTEKQGIAVDENAKKKAIDAQKDGKDEVDLHQVVLKAVYESTLEKYYKLKESLQVGPNGQVYTGDVSVPKKQSTELVLMENYLRKIDNDYRSHTGHFISSDDKDIGGKENTLAHQTEKNEQAINRNSDKNFKRIHELHEKLQDISDSIVYLSGMTSNLDSESFKTQMDALQKRYLDISFEITQLEPNPAEYNRQISEKQKEEEFRDKTVGVAYDKQKAKTGAVKSDVGSLQSGNDAKQEKLTTSADRNVRDMSSDISEKVSELLEEFYKQCDMGYFKKAEETLQSAEALVGIEIDGSDEHNPPNSNNNQGSREYNNAFKNELDKGTVSGNELAKRDSLKLRANDVKAKVNYIEKGKDKDARTR